MTPGPLPGRLLTLIVCETVLLYTCYVLAAVLEGDSEIYLLYDSGWLQIAIIVLIIQIGFYFQSLYQSILPRSRMELVQQLCLVLGFSFLFQAVLGYGDWDLQSPKGTMVYGSLLVVVGLPAWRMAFTVISRAVPQPRLLFLGHPPVVHEIAAQLIRRPELGLQSLGFLDTPSSKIEPVPIPWLGTVGDLDQAIETHHPNRVVISAKEQFSSLPVRRLLDLPLAGIQVEEASALYETLFRRVFTRTMPPARLVFGDASPHAASFTLQTALSPLLGLLAAMILAPILLAVALLSKISSPGPALLRLQRMGLGGSVFTLYRFRLAPAGKLQQGPEPTRIGYWLRKLHLDGLPQLLNVIRGEMTFVGPEPESPEYSAALEKQIPFYRQRYSIKPGIAGWAQLNYQGGDPQAGPDDAITKLEYDLYYLKHRSPALDAYILIHSLVGL